MDSLPSQPMLCERFYNFDYGNEKGVLSSDIGVSPSFFLPLSFK